MFSLLVVGGGRKIPFLGACQVSDGRGMEDVIRPFVDVARFDAGGAFSCPCRSSGAVLFPVLMLILFALFIKTMKVPFFGRRKIKLSVLSGLLAPSVGLLRRGQARSIS